MITMHAPPTLLALMEKMVPFAPQQRDPRLFVIVPAMSAKTVRVPATLFLVNANTPFLPTILSARASPTAQARPVNLVYAPSPRIPTLAKTLKTNAKSLLAPKRVVLLKLILAPHVTMMTYVPSMTPATVRVIVLVPLSLVPLTVTAIPKHPTTPAFSLVRCMAAVMEAPIRAPVIAGIPELALAEMMKSLVVTFPAWT